ncbi:MAG: transcription-repair coupling factor [Pirellulaceae bacterium]|nr:transcription-repair coupling factor [Pirellulaceae bacterium]
MPRGLESAPGFAEIVTALRDQQAATVDGAWGALCALLTAAVRNQISSPIVLVCPKPDDIDLLCGDLEIFSSGPATRFPAWESNFGEQAIHDEIFGERLRALKQLAINELQEAAVPHESPLLVTSIQSLLQPVPGPKTVRQSTRTLRVGESLEIDACLRWLVEHDFHNTSAVELPGEFSQRGGIIDLFAPDWTTPVRIELFDDEIESIRRFDLTSQRSTEHLSEIEITALPPSTRNDGQFADFLPADSCFIFLEPEQIETQGQQFLARLERPQDFFSVADVKKATVSFANLSVYGISPGSFGPACHLSFESVERFSGEIGRVRDELDRIGEGHDVYVVSPTEAEIERLGELLANTNLAGRGNLHFGIGNLSAGFRFPATKTVVVTSHELFHRGELRRIPRRRLGKAIDSFLDLQEGNLVVHLAHGIGRYRGLELLNKDGVVEEHLVIEFHGGTCIYVPATRIDLVQKYVGGAKSRPALARIGGKAWLKQKKAAEAAVADLAAEMLELQAARVARPGISFAVESDWQQEFDSSFPYQETTDQLTAIDAIRNDMLASRPMDRLLCGDVGFGKTELAMRASFKAVDNGYQVAVLVPTTILAEQHFRTFRDRMAEFPFDIAKLSRFCSTKEQKDVAEGLALGRIDIVVGTHRLASKDIEFFNLGLVIIDEEQRFGVEVKERLKSLRSTVDILTMSATPIPRTLHMSLVGVRDISNLETPPEDRIAVETRVTRWDNELIRRAVLRELNRGGQIYFVHNRVNDLHVVEQKLKQIVPEARIQIGHGQMPESQLEQVMVDFVSHRFDLLLATTIVESGLDIPNANTIFIDEADRYGLADLHQLRGRVGRYKHRAFCYLMIDPNRHISPTASKRLRAIEEFSDMGAGFAIAMRDLEIRGAGNLLGTQQSGHISAVGYELYCQLLESSVRSLQQLPAHIRLEIDIDLPGEAFLTDGYVPDMRTKIDIYRRLSRVDDYDKLSHLRMELVDRFGALPAATERLFELTELKLDAAVWQIAAIYLEDNFLAFHYTNRPRIEQLARQRKKSLRIVDDRMAYLKLTKEVKANEDLLKTVKSLLQPN